MSILTKAQLIAGAQYTEDIDIEDLGTVKVRALSDGEMVEIETNYMLKMEAEGISTADLVSQVDTSISKTTALARLGKERDWALVAKGLSIGGESWTPEEVKLLTEGVIDQVRNKIEQLSKGKKDQIESFRGNDGRVGVNTVN